MEAEADETADGGPRAQTEAMEPEALVLLSPLTVGFVFWLIDEDCMGKYVSGRQGSSGVEKEADRL